MSNIKYDKNGDPVESFDPVGIIDSFYSSADLNIRQSNWSTLSPAPIQKTHSQKVFDAAFAGSQPKDFPSIKSTPTTAPEKSGGSVNYYKVQINDPTSGSNNSYMAECNDIIEALNMNYTEGNIFKAIWRMAAARELGKFKEGFEKPKYDTEKVVFFANRLMSRLLNQQK